MFARVVILPSGRGCRLQTSVASGRVEFGTAASNDVTPALVGLVKLVATRVVRSGEGWGHVRSASRKVVLGPFK